MGNKKNYQKIDISSHAIILITTDNDNIAIQ